MSDILFTNGAVQNRGFELDEFPGKVTGIMLAQVLNRLNDNTDVVHVWNNVGAFHADEVLSPSSRLEDKYSSHIMTEHIGYWGLVKDNVQIIGDDNQKFSEWVVGKLDGLLESGTITLEQSEFDACGDCEIVVAESVAGVQCCPKCSNDALGVVSEVGLFVNVPENRMQLLDDSLIYNSMNLRNERDSLKQIPPRLLLSRDREIGVSLGNFDLEGKKLDPRMGIGMLALYAAEINDYETVAVAQTTSTLIRTAPYIGSVLLRGPDTRRLLFVPHTRIEARVFDDADAVGRQVIAPFAAAQRNQDVNIQRYQQATKEFMKLGRNAAALRTILERLGLDTCNDEPHFETLPSGLTDLISGMGKQSGKAIEQLKRKESADDVPPQIVKEANELISVATAFNL